MPNNTPQRTEYRRKPRKCPACGHAPLATILYGMPMFNEKLEQDIEAGKIVIGGCCVSMDDPVWECSQCGLQIYRQNEQASMS